MSEDPVDQVVFGEASLPVRKSYPTVLAERRTVPRLSTPNYLPYPHEQCPFMPNRLSKIPSCDIPEKH